MSQASLSGDRGKFSKKTRPFSYLHISKQNKTKRKPCFFSCLFLSCHFKENKEKGVCSGQVNRKAP